MEPDNEINLVILDHLRKVNKEQTDMLMKLISLRTNENGEYYMVKTGSGAVPSAYVDKNKLKKKGVGRRK